MTATLNNNHPFFQWFAGRKQITHYLREPLPKNINLSITYEAFEMNPYKQVVGSPIVGVPLNLDRTFITYEVSYRCADSFLNGLTINVAITLL
ncbi:MAG: hypothetical protein LBQ20_03835 [Rhodanobacter sp.]|nr:hypothetical protein [Rhodanobacter sp.]